MAAAGFLDRPPVERDAIVRILIAGGASVSATDRFGRTALFYAVIRGYVSTVRILLAEGSSVDMTDNAGYSLLWYAQRDSTPECIAILEEAISSAAARNGGCGGGSRRCVLS